MLSHSWLLRQSASLFFCVVIWQVIDSYTIKWEAEDMLEEEYWEIVKRIREMRKDD